MVLSRLAILVVVAEVSVIDRRGSDTLLIMSALAITFPFPMSVIDRLREISESF